MKNSKNSYSNRDKETVDAAESFNYVKEHNNDPRTNEFFVYHYEDNKSYLGKEDNTRQLGKEQNADVSKAKEVKTEDYSKRQDLNSGATESTSASSATTSATESAVSTTTSAATANTVGAAVETAAVVATTVVVAVGGGIIINNQTIKKPEICLFDSLYAEQNKIFYKLNIGDSLEQINSGQPGDECDVVIELSSYTNEIIDSAKVTNYGRAEGSFEGLNYSTEYTVSVFLNPETLIPAMQMAEEVITNSDGRILLLEEKVTTPEEEKPTPYVPNPELNKLYVRAEIDQGGTAHYYIDIDYDTQGQYYSDFSVQYFDLSVEPQPVSDKITLQTPFDDWQEIPTPTGFNINGTYNMYIYCMSSYPGDQPQALHADEEAQKTEILLFKQEVDFSTVEIEKANHEFSLVFEGYKDKYGMVTYYSTFSYTDPNGYYSDFAFLFYKNNEQILSTYPSNTTGQKSEIALRGIDKNDTYQIRLMCESTSPYDYTNDGSGQSSSTTIEFGQIEVDFNLIHMDQEPLSSRNLEFYKYKDMYEDIYLYGTLSFEDEYDYYSGFSLVFKGGNIEPEKTVEVAFEEIDPEGATQEINFDGMDLEETYDVDIMCWSTNPADQQEGANPATGGADGVQILFFSIEGVDFSKLSVEVETPSFEPSATFDKHVDSFLNETLYVTLLYYDWAERYGNFRFKFEDDDDTYPIDYPYNNERQLIRGFNPSNRTGNQTVEVWCDRTSYADAGQGYDTIKLFETEIDFDHLQEEREPIDPSLETHQLDFTIEYDIYQIPHYYVQLIYEDENNYYSNFVLYFYENDEPIGEYSLASNGAFGYGTKQEIDEDSVPLNAIGSYEIKVYCDSTNPRDEELQGQLLWFTQESDFSLINPQTTVNNIYLSFEKHIEEDLSENLYINVAYDDPDEMLYGISVGIMIDDQEYQMMVSNPNSGEPCLLDMTAPGLTFEMLTGELTVNLYGTRMQDGANYIMSSQTFDFDEMEVVTADVTNNIFFKKLMRQNGEEVYYALLTCPNEDDYYSYFEIRLYDLTNGEQECFVSLPTSYLGGTYIPIEFDLPELQEYEVRVMCYSYDPDDIAADPEGVNQSEGPTGAVQIELFRKNIDFNDIPVEYEPYTEPQPIGVVFEEFLSYYGNSLGRFTTVNFTDPCDFYGEFTITLTDPSTYREYCSFTFDAESGVRQVVGDGQGQFQRCQDEMEVKVDVVSFDPTIENQTADGTLVGFTIFTYDFGDLEAELSTEVPYIEYGVTRTQNLSDTTYEITATIYYDYLDDYSSYYLHFTPISMGNESWEYIVTPTSGVPITLSNFADGENVYLVELTTTDGRVLYTEEINFASIT